ncbi:hypothetical protein NOVA_35850 [Nocardia nova]|uniref:hypothetical protein n=1 Tax=Nocardia nova TaxID=37330 RepID=UPI001C46A871|nr:hypothetical protein [Nocardia nova]MBV7708163.1 hypothetical protein [Nocardia nova]
MSDVHDVVVAAVTSIISRRGDEFGGLKPGTKLGAELGFNSLEFAELSAQLEDIFDHDPFSAGGFPETVEEIVDYYRLAVPGTQS